MGCVNRAAIRQNLVDCMRTLLAAGESMGIPLVRDGGGDIKATGMVTGDVCVRLNGHYIDPLNASCGGSVAVVLL